MNAQLEVARTESGLPVPVADRGITKEQWRTLMGSLYPGAKGESVLLVWDYCKSRKLDPLKKPCHIVSMRVKVPGTRDQYEWRDVVMPGVYELRTTAQRTGEYMGHSVPEYGEKIEHAGVAAPEWCSMMIYRWHGPSKQRIEFPVRVYFTEAVALKDGVANQRWAKAPIQMLTKCTEAAGLREAFPDELGGEMAAEEMRDQVIDAEVITKPETETITRDQAEELREGMGLAGLGEQKICEYAKVSCLEDLPADQYEHIKSQINAALDAQEETV